MTYSFRWFCLGGLSDDSIDYIFRYGVSITLQLRVNIRFIQLKAWLFIAVSSRLVIDRSAIEGLIELINLLDLVNKLILESPPVFCSGLTLLVALVDKLSEIRRLLVVFEIAEVDCLVHEHFLHRLRPRLLLHAPRNLLADIRTIRHGLYLLTLGFCKISY